MRKQTSPTKVIEHRGFDVSATKNFDLEMKIIKALNRPNHNSKSGKN